MAVRQVRKQRGGTKNQVSIVEVHLGSKLSVRATWCGHTHHEIYCHFTCGDEVGPLQCMLCVDAVFLRRLDYPPPAQGPRKGPLFYLWLSINCGIRNNDSVRGPKCLVPPWSRTVEEPRTPRLFHFSEWTCISQNFNDRRDAGPWGRSGTPATAASHHQYR
jgi:hypothetical protein